MKIGKYAKNAKNRIAYFQILPIFSQSWLPCLTAWLTNRDVLLNQAGGQAGGYPA
jgi:hypothetical protein